MDAADQHHAALEIGIDVPGAVELDVVVGRHDVEESDFVQVGLVDVLEVEAPHRLSITWGVASEVLFELTDVGGEVLLSITHRRPPNRDVLLNVSAGWHAHLDVLEARLAQAAAAPHWDNFVRLRAEYDQRHPQ